ncbi:MAG: dihydroorotase [Pirellulaceae bacterium]|nr:dihydroorotase [Pirellulaceae bacterium]
MSHPASALSGEGRERAWLIEGARMIDPSQNLDRVGRLLMVDGEIAAIDPLDGDIPAYAKRVSASDQILIPGLVDLGAELGEPGREEDETILSGALAALAGGYTSIACMPNTDPPIDTAAAVEFVRQKAARADRCRVYVIGCVSKDRVGVEMAEIGSLVEAGAVALSDAPRPLENTALLRRALEYCLMFDRPILDRPEVISLTHGGVMHEGLTQLVLGLAPLPAEAEDLATARDLRMLETTGGRLHLTSISTAGSVELLRRSKARGVRVTAGVRITNLCFDDQNLRTFDANYKVNPPLRDQVHIAACLEALRDGTVDLISSGHQPCSLEKKMQELDNVPFGVTSLDTALSLVISRLIRPGHLSWARAIECMSLNPASVINIDAGTLRVGKPGDVTLIDPEQRWIVEPAALRSRSRNTPLLGEELTGRAIMTWVGGQRKFVWA